MSEALNTPITRQALSKVSVRLMEVHIGKAGVISEVLTSVMFGHDDVDLGFVEEKRVSNISITELTAAERRVLDGLKKRAIDTATEQA